MDHIDEKQPVICIFVDLAKVFDTVDHTQLLYTLDCIGFRSIAKEFMTRYLRGTKQFVKIDNFESEVTESICGVPQSTVLGSLLFNINMNDLYNSLQTGNITSCADDTAII